MVLFLFVEVRKSWDIYRKFFSLKLKKNLKKFKKFNKRKK